MAMRPLGTPTDRFLPLRCLYNQVPRLDVILAGVAWFGLPRAFCNQAAPLSIRASTQTGNLRIHLSFPSSNNTIFTAAILQPVVDEL